MCGRVAFLEDYDLTLAATLIQGVDLWINTPRRPWEASGTSGMKVLVNGGLNLSELDGWWVEAYTPAVGWALGDGSEHYDIAAWDAAEAAQLYRLLEEQVVPCFYRSDAHGMPVEWIARIRQSMSLLTTRFSTNRMLREYSERFYIPLATGYRQRLADEGRTAAALEQWRKSLERHWSALRFGNVSAEPTEGHYQFEVQVYLDDIPPDAVRVELYADAGDAGDPVTQPMARMAPLAGAGHGYAYRAAVPALRPASAYTPRIVPQHPAAAVPLEANLILWYR